MKKLLVISTFAIFGCTSIASAASDSGIYLGLEAGLGMTNWKNIGNSLEEYHVGSVSNDSGFVGRVFLGYDINQYFALEGGYSHFFNEPEATVNFSIGGVLFKRKASLKRTQAIDVMGKGKLPVTANFNLYAKLGINYLMSSWDVANISDTKNFNLAYGAGADYYIMPNVIINLEWLRFNGCDKISNDYQPHTDAFMLGLRYKFNY